MLKDKNIGEIMNNNTNFLRERIKNDIENGGLPEVDVVAGVPDSGTPHAIGYANESKLPFARPFIKYTDRKSVV